MKQNKSQLFRCRVTRVRGRNSIFINFREKFWNGVKPSKHTAYRPQAFIQRVYFFEQDEQLFISFKDPIHLPMYKVFIRRLQIAGRNDMAYKVTVPIQLVKKYNLRQYNIVNLQRLKNQAGLVHTCIFEYNKSLEKTPIVKNFSKGIYVPLIDLLR